MGLVDRLVSLSLPAVPKPIVGYFSKRYIAGPTMPDAFRVAREMAAQGAMCTLDILGEFIRTTDEAETNTEAYIELLRRIDGEGLADVNVSVKLSALGLLLDEAQCLGRMRRLVGVAAELGNFIRLDMEDSPCTDATLRIHGALREAFPGRVGVVLQSRLRRTVDDVERLCALPTNVRLCKGIYLEPRPIAWTAAEAIRRNYVLALERLVHHGAYVGIATHDELLVWEALRLIRAHGLDRTRYEFQMLLGVDEELRRILIDAGHRLRVYVPYGEHWYSYSVRRLRENPQIAGYAFRAMFRRG